MARESPRTLHLFQPLVVAHITLTNRIVLEPIPSGYLTQQGTIPPELYTYYVRRAHGGVGLIVTEPFLVASPKHQSGTRHLALYHDQFIGPLRQLTDAIHGANARIFVLLDAPGELAEHNPNVLMLAVTDAFVKAAYRALQAGCDGVVLSAANGGVLHRLLSPLHNPHQDFYGQSPAGRLFLALAIIQGIRARCGSQLVRGFRLLAEEFRHGGLTIEQSQEIAYHLVKTGIDVLDVATDARHDTALAQFPGWTVPLANSIKQAVPQVPVIGAGNSSDPMFAESLISDGSVDLVMLGNTLKFNPYWAHLARIVLMAQAPS